jgi:hypothetical protein
MRKDTPSRCPPAHRGRSRPPGWKWIGRRNAVRKRGQLLADPAVIVFRQCKARQRVAAVRAESGGDEQEIRLVLRKGR